MQQSNEVLAVKFTPPLEIEELQRLEEDYAIQLPKDYRAFITQYGGLELDAGSIGIEIFGADTLQQKNKELQTNAEEWATFFCFGKVIADVTLVCFNKNQKEHSQVFVLGMGYIDSIYPDFSTFLEHAIMAKNFGISHFWEREARENDFPDQSQTPYSVIAPGNTGEYA